MCSSSGIRRESTVNSGICRESTVNSGIRRESTESDRSSYFEAFSSSNRGNVVTGDGCFLIVAVKMQFLLLFYVHCQLTTRLS